MSVLKIKDQNGQWTDVLSIKGEKGDNGQDYVLTENDKQEIAQDVAELVDIPVDDVQINGVSVVSNGVANIPYGTNNVYGIVMDAAHVGDLKNRFDIVTFYNNSFGCLSSIQQIECLNTLNSIIVPDGILLISCFERLDLIKQSYSEWGFPHAIIDYSTGIADLGEYKSNWKTKDIFLPFFARNSEFSLEDSDESGLGTVYIFRKKGRR